MNQAFDQYPEKEMPDLLERLLMFTILVSDLLKDKELLLKAEQLNYSFTNFLEDEENAIENFYKKVEVLLGEIFPRLPLSKLDKSLLEFPDQTEELKLLKNRFILLAVVPLMIEGTSENDFKTNQQVLIDLITEAAPLQKKTTSRMDGSIR